MYLVVSRSHCHTSDNIVTVIVTSHKVTKKSIEDSGKIILYNVYYILKVNTWSFRIG